MDGSQFNRRDFHKWTMAAFGGLVAGVAGCGGEQQPGGNNAAPAGGQDAQPQDGGAPAGSDTGGSAEGAGEATLTDAQQIMLEEPHVCRGLNACQGLGAGQNNACAGQGACATAAAHDCHQMNACKGQGGCGDTAGRNACKGQGECAVPLSDETWQKARQAFEEAMQAAGKQVGVAPAKS